MTMKYFSIIIITLLSLFIASCNGTGGDATRLSVKDLPEGLNATFQDMFPAAESVTWTMEKEDTKSVYVAAFTEGTRKLEAYYNKKGKWQETKEAIKITELSGAVSDAVKVSYLQYTVVEAEKIYRNDNGIYYELELEGDNDQILEVTFDQSGLIDEEQAIDDE